MLRQTGPVELDDDGIIRRGTIIRHLILPGCVNNSLKVLDWIGDTFAPGEVLVSLMRQYTPMGNLPAPLALAYVGDAAHSLYIRKKLVARGIVKSGELNALSLEYVTAEQQALAYERIAGELTELESDMFRTAFNSSHLNKPKRASGKAYRSATGFEAVIGMLIYLGREERFLELMKIAYPED